MTRELSILYFTRAAAMRKKRNIYAVDVKLLPKINICLFTEIVGMNKIVMSSLHFELFVFTLIATAQWKRIR